MGVRGEGKELGRVVPFRLALSLQLPFLLLCTICLHRCCKLLPELMWMRQRFLGEGRPGGSGGLMAVAGSTMAGLQIPGRRAACRRWARTCYATCAALGGVWCDVSSLPCHHADWGFLPPCWKLRMPRARLGA